LIPLQKTVRMEIVVGVSNIVVERNSENNANYALPAVLPLDLCSMDTRLFAASLVQQQCRLQQRFSEDSERIDEQLRNLRLALKKERGLARILKEKQARTVVSSFLRFLESIHRT
jgi:erythromycin esterase-like protein